MSVRELTHAVAAHLAELERVLARRPIYRMRRCPGTFRECGAGAACPCGGSVPA